MDKFKEYQNSHCGVGGVHCDCCNDYKGKHRKKLNRLARKSFKEETIKEINDEILF